MTIWEPHLAIHSFDEQETKGFRCMLLRFQASQILTRSLPTAIHTSRSFALDIISLTATSLSISTGRRAFSRQSVFETHRCVWSYCRGVGLESWAIIARNMS